MYGSDNATQSDEAMPDRNYPMNETHESMLGGGDMPDRPLSSTETSMMTLEQEIMQLDESFSELTRKLQPVRDNSIEKAASEKAGLAGGGDRAVRSPLSPIAQSIDEKANRVRQIRQRINSVMYSIDL